MKRNKLLCLLYMLKSIFDVDRLSIIVTPVHLTLLLRSACARCCPMNPAPPRIKLFIDIS